MPGPVPSQPFRTPLSQREEHRRSRDARHSVAREPHDLIAIVGATNRGQHRADLTGRCLQRRQLRARAQLVRRLAWARRATRIDDDLGLARKVPAFLGRRRLTRAGGGDRSDVDALDRSRRDGRCWRWIGHRHDGGDLVDCLHRRRLPSVAHLARLGRCRWSRILGGRRVDVLVHRTRRARPGNRGLRLRERPHDDRFRHAVGRARRDRRLRLVSHQRHRGLVVRQCETRSELRVLGVVRRPIAPIHASTARQLEHGWVRLAHGRRLARRVGNAARTHPRCHSPLRRSRSRAPSMRESSCTRCPSEGVAMATTTPSVAARTGRARKSSAIRAGSRLAHTPSARPRSMRDSRDRSPPDRKNPAIASSDTPRRTNARTNAASCGGRRQDLGEIVARHQPGPREPSSEIVRHRAVSLPSTLGVGVKRLGRPEGSGTTETKAA